MNHRPSDDGGRAIDDVPPAGDAARPEAVEHAIGTARARALRTARVVTLGLALGASTPGCTAATDLASNLYCDVFTSTRFCCERTGYSYWDAATNTCHVRAVPGPLVAPPS